MLKEIEALEAREQVSSYLKRYTESAELYMRFENLRKAYEQLFSFGNAFIKILQKACLINENSSFVELPSLEDSRFLKTSISIPPNKDMKIFEKTIESYSAGNTFGISSKSSGEEEAIEYVIQLSNSGTISVITYRKNGKADISVSSYPEGKFYLNLPILIYNVMHKKNESKSRMQLEEIAKSNPTSLIGNICNYVKKNPKKIEALVKNLTGLESEIKKLTSSMFDGSDNFHLYNFFTAVIGKNSVPYLITAENKVPLIKMNLQLGDTSKNPRFTDGGDFFPALIKFEQKKIGIYFLKKFDFDYLVGDFDCKKKLAPLKLDSWCFIEKDGKVKEELQEEKLRYKTALRNWEESKEKDWCRKSFNIRGFRPAEKNWDYVADNYRKIIEDNSDKVLSMLLSFINNSQANRQVANQEMKVKTTELALQKCKEKENAIAGILMDIYAPYVLVSRV
jgi:hypothetical protein